MSNTQALGCLIHYIYRAPEDADRILSLTILKAVHAMHVHVYIARLVL